eukprot:TRINITY_DN55475_c0_g2_i1.p1 TRINITY_DN55475_c0_g2~~TRINITY_DN55475_c0_g2_i1.p1  ORF type:complete len:205 (-),score=24.96 TRINITY_DN55475_c0_g2_i1:10-624(-)
MLVGADQRNIGVWNYEEKSKDRINSFKNDNPRGSSIVTMQWINDLHLSLLLCASDDGAVRIWKDIHDSGRQSLVTAMIAFPNEPNYSSYFKLQNIKSKTAELSVGDVITAPSPSLPPPTSSLKSQTPTSKKKKANHVVFDSHVEYTPTSHSHRKEKTPLPRTVSMPTVTDHLSAPSPSPPLENGEIGRAVQQECRDRSRMPSSA